MKYATSAVVALAVGLGLATAAQSHGLNRQSAIRNQNNISENQPAMSGSSMPPSAMQMQGTRQMRTAQAGQRVTRQEMKQVQQALQQDGLYKGRIDGKFGAGTRRAVAEFQQQNGLPRTARLDQNTLSQLTGGQNAGVGSSTPQNNNLGSTSTVNPGQPTTPPATQAPNAGDNTNNTLQNNNYNKTTK